MRTLEDRLEELYGYAGPSTGEGLAAIRALLAGGVLCAERAAFWRARFERERRSRAPTDADLRARCLALLASLPPDESGEDPAGELPFHFSEAGLITHADLGDDDDADLPALPALPAPLGVALGPPSADGGIRVVWIATFERWVEIALADAPLDRFDAGAVALRDAAGTTYEDMGYSFGNLRGHLRFTPRPPAATVELLIGAESIVLPVP